MDAGGRKVVGEGTAVEMIEGLWYFWDETWSHTYGPFPTEAEAEAAVKRYCEEFLGAM